MGGIQEYGEFDDNISYGPVLVGAGTYDGSELIIPTIGSTDLTGYNGPHQAGWVDGNVIEVKVWRDNDKDSRLDTENVNVDEGMYGINIHRHSRPNEKEYVNGSSAGCQVFKDSK